jgi:hypothetical protein
LAGHELHEVAVAVAGRKLREAEPVAQRVETHRLGIDGDARTEIDTGWKIALMKMDRHVLPLLSVMRAEMAWCPGEDSNFHDLSITRT